jgi:hypothetical protein
MINNITSNDNNNCNDRVYNCAGHGYRNLPRYLLRLILLKKSGFFCPECTEYLKDNGLIDCVLDDSVGKSKRVTEEKH